MSNERAANRCELLLWCLLMLANISGLIAKAPHDALHIWIAVGSGIILISTFISFSHLKNKMIIMSLVVIITGLTGTIQHYLIGTELTPPVIYTASGLLVLICKLTASHIIPKTYFTLQKRNHAK